MEQSMNPVLAPPFMSQVTTKYCQTSNISLTLGHKFVDNSDVVGASPGGVNLTLFVAGSFSAKLGFYSLRRHYLIGIEIPIIHQDVWQPCQVYNRDSYILWDRAGWDTKIFWHSPELGSLLYSLYKIPLAQACVPLAPPNFHSHWRAGER